MTEFHQRCGKFHSYCGACMGHWVDHHDDGCPCIPFTRPVGETVIPEAAIKVGALALDHGHLPGRFCPACLEDAHAVLAAVIPWLLAAGWTPPGGTGANVGQE